MDKKKREQYLISFPDGAGDSKRHAALEEARANRKFEIELYWKRAGYFWLFIAAAFGGYGYLRDNQIIAFTIACSGFLFSLAWYFVNRGSKYWQGNWELHVDLLEDDISGPIYKTVVQPSECDLCEFEGPYPFSVSKINQLLSLFVTVVWLVPLTRTVLIVWGFEFDCVAAPCRCYARRAHCLGRSHPFLQGSHQRSRGRRHKRNILSENANLRMICRRRVAHARPVHR